METEPTETEQSRCTPRASGPASSPKPGYLVVRNAIPPWSILQSLEVGNALFQAIKYRDRGLVVVQKSVMDALIAGFAGQAILEMK